MDVRLERLPSMRAAHVHVFSESPEEDAWRKMEAWAEPRGLLGEGAGTRVFGRNTYPTDEPEPYGYEFFLTVGPDVEAGGEIDIGARARNGYEENLTSLEKDPNKWVFDLWVQLKE